MKTTTFANRHIGIGEKELPLMLKKIGVRSLDELIEKTIPANILLKEPLKLGAAMTEREFAEHIGKLAAQNKLYKTYIGCGWYDTVTPAVVQRNVFENPVWYTSYTPYQAEISQGRLEALLNFQTVISDLTALPLANCSLLDEATAAAEAATMMYGLRSRAQQKAQANVLFVDEEIFPQTLAVIRTRAIPQGMVVKVGSYKDLTFTPDIFGCIVQYPNNSGSIEDYREFAEQAHAAGCKVAVAADILSLALLVPPGEWGADIAFGSSQRLGTPMFYGGPSAAYFATRDEYKRNMPGRIIGLSKDKYGHLCYRMALQTREQHIKREKATSNICTAQALLATMAGFYAVYHGPDGIKEIANHVHAVAFWLAEQLTNMKLNAASEMLPLSNAAWMNLHPLVPEDQAAGYQALIHNLSEQLKTITGFAGVSLQPNSGAAGEYTGLRVIRSYQESIGQGNRRLVLIPASAHGTNPASAVQAGYEPLTCACDENGNVDLEDLRAKAEAHKDELAALMITYPSTHGIFEEEIKEICEIIHACGAQVYMDGANMNGQVGLTNPGTIGADVCHLNLHKTFASPHGGGGPGVGPICVAEHLVPFLPGHVSMGNPQNEVSAAPYGSAGILPITYGYICMMGAEGLRRATQTAILNANYLAACLKDAYGVVYRGKNGFVGHEMILECRKIHEESGISENDISKRLMDYGYHAPTLSFPVHGTLMIEPTESESLAELDNFVDVMVHIREEIAEIETGKADKEDNVLVNAPHPEYEIVGDAWTHPYGRAKAAYPIQSVRDNKFWINVARIDNTLGDRKLLPTRYGSFE